MERTQINYMFIALEPLRKLKMAQYLTHGPTNETLVLLIRTCVLV